MARLRKSKRQLKRTKAVLPTRFWIAGNDETHLAHTLDASRDGVMLGGFRGELEVGDKIEIQYHHKRAQFRVVWIKAREGSSEKQVGVECVDPTKHLWEAEFPEQEDDYE